MFSVHFCRDGEGTDEVTSVKIVKKLADTKYTGIGNSQKKFYFISKREVCETIQSFLKLNRFDAYKYL